MTSAPRRVFEFAGLPSPGIEAVQFYDINGRYEVIADSVPYQLYRIWIIRQHGWRWWQFWHWPQVEQEAMLGMANVLDVLITPDELRAWPGWGYVECYPNHSFDDACWSDYGGWY